MHECIEILAVPTGINAPLERRGAFRRTFTLDPALREAVVIDHISGAAAALATPHPERRRTRRNEPNHATDHENQKSNTHDNLQRETVSVRTPPQD